MFNFFDISKWRQRRGSSRLSPSTGDYLVADSACDRTLQGFMNAAKALDPGEVNPPQIVKHIRYRYYVRLGPGDNWSGDAFRIHQIGAREAPVQFYRTQIVAPKQAAPIRYLDGLNFVAKDEKDARIAYLPLELEDRRKRLLLIFTPPINPGDSVRSVTSSYNWDGMWNRLKLYGEDLLEWPYSSREPCELFEVEVFWDPDLQARIEFALLARHDVEPEGPEALIDDDRRWPGRKYVIRNVQPGTTITGTLSVIPPRQWTSSLGLLSIAERKDCLGHVVFVHGLGGDPITTWHPTDRPNLFWPDLLAFASPRVSIWSVGYAAHGSGWGGKTKRTMSLEERATNILASMEANGLGQRPIIFVCHSYGGLVVKQMLRNAMDRNDHRWRAIAKNTKGIFFLSTPHSGSDLANYITNLSLLFQPTDIVYELRDSNAYLTNLNHWYQENSLGGELSVATEVLYEKLKTYGKYKTGPFLVVDAASADPGISGVGPIPVDEDHESICKPRSTEAVQCALLHQFVNRIFLQPLGSRLTD